MKIDEIRINTRSEFPWDLSLWRRPECQILSTALDISITTTRVSQDLLNALAIPLDTTVRRSRRPEIIMEARKKSHFARWSTSLLFLFLTDFPKRRKKGGWYFFLSCRPLTNNLQCRDHRCQIPKIRKQDSFRYILTSSVNLQESSGSQFLRTTTEIQPGPDADLLN